MSIKWIKVEAGLYRSEDGRWAIADFGWNRVSGRRLWAIRGAVPGPGFTDSSYTLRAAKERVEGFIAAEAAAEAKRA